MKKTTSAIKTESRSGEFDAETSTFFKARDHERRAAKNGVAKCIELNRFAVDRFPPQSYPFRD